MLNAIAAALAGLACILMLLAVVANETCRIGRYGFTVWESRQ